MSLVELMHYLINPELLGGFYQEKGFDPESDSDVLIYMKSELALDSELAFFEEEETDDEVEYQKNNVCYLQLFSVGHAIDLIDHDLDMKDKGYTHLEIAKRLLEYRINDA